MKRQVEIEKGAINHNKCSILISVVDCIERAGHNLECQGVTSLEVLVALLLDLQNFDLEIKRAVRLNTPRRESSFAIGIICAGL